MSITKSLLLIFLVLFEMSCQKRKVETSLFLKKAHEALLKAQEENGSWDPQKSGGNYKSEEGIIATTALSLAALLHNPQESDAQIKKAIHFLLERQTENGNISNQNYANALSLYALSLANKKKLVQDKNIISLAKYILAQQSNTGAWDYTLANDHRNDLSITGWVFLGLTNLPSHIAEECKVQLAIKKLNAMLEADLSGVGNTSPIAKANSYYTYGDDPNSKIGKVSRSPGATIQAITLMIRCQDKKNHLDQWTQVAIEDQIKSFDEKNAYSLYKAFFNVHSNLSHNAKNKAWLDKIKKQIENNQTISGFWEPTDHPTRFGGTVFSTALATIILTHPCLFYSTVVKRNGASSER